MRQIASVLFAGLLAGCGPSAPPAGYAGDDARDFVRQHRAELEAEIGTGSGPRLYDLAIIANCQDVPQLGRRLHKNRDELFAPAPGAAAGEGTPSDEVVAERVVRFLADAPDVRCLGLDLSRQRSFAAGRRHIGPRRSTTTSRGGTP